MKIMMRTSSTSIIGVMLISALSGPPPAVEKDILHSSQARACLWYWTLAVVQKFPGFLDAEAKDFNRPAQS
jgi:hypothetical protein